MIRVGGTTRVNLVILNTTSQRSPLFTFFDPFPTLTIRDASGDTVSVAYTTSGLVVNEFTVDAHRSFTVSTILGAGNAVMGATALANLTPGVYSVAACMGSSCGQPVSITITQ